MDPLSSAEVAGRPGAPYPARAPICSGADYIEAFADETCASFSSANASRTCRPSHHPAVHQCRRGDLRPSLPRTRPRHRNILHDGERVNRFCTSRERRDLVLQNKMQRKLGQNTELFPALRRHGRAQRASFGDL